QTDVAGNVSQTSHALTLVTTRNATVVVAPTSLDLAANDDSGLSSSDNITKTSRGLTISGIGTKDAKVTLFNDKNSNNQMDKDESLGSVEVHSATGQWNKEISIPSGTHAIRAVQTSHQVVSVASDALLITVDTTAPSAPSLGSSSLTLVGMGEVGAMVTLFEDLNSNGKKDSNEKILGGTTCLVSGNGSWASGHVLSTLKSGKHAMRAFQTDRAGNVSPVSGVLSLSIAAASKRVDLSSPATIFV
ncbi:MAG: hypothetical protein HQL58_07955, partial [Magnetococcales bacterium]|nr:hypothetical protein [Magnetococcales bacterium]